MDCEKGQNLICSGTPQNHSYRHAHYLLGLLSHALGSVSTLPTLQQAPSGKPPPKAEVFREKVGCLWTVFVDCGGVCVDCCGLSVDKVISVPPRAGALEEALLLAQE